MNLAKYFWFLGSTTMIVLGTIHLFLTFFTNKFSPTESSLEVTMKTTSPILTDKITMWSGWLGFNASHSIGIIFLGLLNLYLAFKYFKILETDTTYFMLNIIAVGIYIFLAYKYWFNIPLFGLILSFISFTLAYILIITK